MMSAARVRSVRARRTVMTRPITSSASAAGRSQDASPPKAELNIRVQPVLPHMPVVPGPPPPVPTLPVSLPVSRPKPLYPNSTSQKVLFVEPPMYGRFAAGVSTTIAIHQPAPATIETAITMPWRRRRTREPGAATRYANAKPGIARNAWSSLARNAKPRARPTSTTQRVLPSSMARVNQYAPSTRQSTNSASGLLNRNIRVATGVVANTAPASNPAGAPNQRRTAR